MKLLLLLSLLALAHADDPRPSSSRKLLLFTIADTTQVSSVLEANYSSLYQMGFTATQVADFQQEAADYFYTRIGVDFRGVQPVLTDIGVGYLVPVVFGNGGFAVFSTFATPLYQLELSSGIGELHIPQSYTPFIKATPHWILFINPGFLYNGTYTAEGNDARSGPNDQWNYGFMRVQIRENPQPEILNIKYKSYAPSVADQPALSLFARPIARIAERVSYEHPALGVGVGAIDIAFNDRGYWRISNLMTFPASYALP